MHGVLLAALMAVTAPLDVLGGWRGFSDLRNSLYHFVTKQAYQLLAQRKAKVDELRTLEQWQDKQRDTRDALSKAIGPFPPKTPLAAKVLRVVQKDGYSIEHVVYESQPRFHVSSSLFIPDGLTKGQRAPAIVYVSGHSISGYRGGYIPTILNLVKKGFIVFAYDPIGQGERFQYTHLGGNNAEHRYMTGQAFVAGSSLAKYTIWDGIRAVDYLVTRKEVDPARIGMCGRSGGGFQSLYIAAFDDRILATAPENHVTNYTRILQSIGPRDGEQNIPRMFEHEIDHPDFLMARAPKPTMLVTTTNDLFNIQGSLETFEEVSRLYRAYGKQDDFEMIEDLAGHASTTSNNERLYAFFQKHLKNPGDPGQVDVPRPSKQDLQVTPTGQVLSSFKGETVHSLVRKETAASRSHRFGGIAKAKELSGYREPLPSVSPVLTGAVGRSGYQIKKYFLDSDGGYPLPYLLLVPETTNGKAILYLHPAGKAAESKEGGEMEWLVKRGYTVLAPDMVGTGELGPAAPTNDDRYGTWYVASEIGRSIAGIRAGDVNKLAKVLAPQKIYGLAKNEMCPVLLHAAAFNPAIAGVALIEPLVSYRALVDEPLYSQRQIDGTVVGALAVYDLPDLAASLAPRKLLLVDVKDGADRTSDSDSTRRDLAVIKKAYAASKNLVIGSGDFRSHIDSLL